MSLVSFDDDCTLPQIQFRYANDHPPVAVLHAREGANPGQLAGIRRAMRAQGWEATPVEIEGKPVLQVSGFEKEEQFLSHAYSMGFVKGDPRVTAETGDDATRGWRQRMADNGIKVGGALNLLGDGGLLLSGLMSRRSQEAVAGGLYTAGALVAARYGNVKTEYHVKKIQGELAEFMKQQAESLPEDCGLYTILRDYRNGAVQKAEDILYRYPSQVTLSAYTLGALSMLQSGIKHRKAWDTAYGVNSVATKVAALMVPEKHKDTQEPAETQMGKLVQWVQEKPLRIFGYGSMVSDALLGMSAYREYRTNPGQKSYFFKFLTTGTYIASDLMFAISSKDTAGAGNGFDADEQRRIEALAAEAIARQPKQMQDPLIHQVAGFLATQPQMHGAAADIAFTIRHQVDGMKKNPWAKGGSHAALAAMQSGESAQGMGIG